MSFSQYTADADDKIITTGLYSPIKRGNSYHIEINGQTFRVRLLCDDDPRVLSGHAEAFRHLASLLDAAATGFTPMHCVNSPLEVATSE